jgi:hypothetical protein
MNKKECYNQGFQTGYDIARENRAEYDLSDENGRDNFVSEMSEHESDVYRQYTPFEFFAKEINDTGDRADGLWAAYDDGVYKGILALVKEEVNLIKNNHE